MEKVPSLALEARESILNGLVLYERVSLAHLKMLIGCVSLLPGMKQGDQTTRPQLEKYLAKIARSPVEGLAQITYSRKVPFGRCNPCGGGLHNLKREIRQTLTHDSYVDIDIVNAHPVILYQVCLRNAVPCPNLAEMVLKREECLASVQKEYEVEREQAKKLFLILVYGGSFSSWASSAKTTKPPSLFLSSLKKEISTIASLIHSLNKGMESILDTKKSTNISARVLSLFLQEYEERILESAYSLCLREGVIQGGVAVLCADGLMLEKCNYREGLLEEFSRSVLEEVGIGVKFSLKEMTDYYTDEQIVEAFSRNIY